MPLPLIAVAAKTIATKAVAATAAKAAIAKTLASKAALKGVAKTALKGLGESTAAKKVASDVVAKPLIKKAITAPVKSVASTALKQVPDKLSIGNLAKPGVNLYPGQAASPSRLEQLANKVKEKTSKMLDSVGEGQQQEPQWSEREDSINALTPGGIPLQDTSVYDEQISKLKNLQ